MAGKKLLTPESKKRILQLKKTTKLTNPQVAKQVAEEFKLERVPSLPTISKVIKEGKIKSTTKTKPITEGEKLLQQAQANPIQNKPITRTEFNNKVNAHKAQLVNEAINTQSMDSLSNVNTDALQNFMGGSDAINALQALNSIEAPKSDGSTSLYEDLLGAVSSSNTVENIKNDDYMSDVNSISQSQMASNNNYKNDDVSFRNQKSYTQKMSERMDDYDDTNQFLQQNLVSDLNSGAGVTIENKAKLFIEKLLKANNIYNIGIIVNGSLLLPSQNIKFTYEIQKACNLSEGFMIINNGVIKIVDDAVAEEFIKVNKTRFSQTFSPSRPIDENGFAGYLFNSLLGIQKMIKKEFTNIDKVFSKPDNIKYKGLVNLFMDDAKSIPYVSVINTINTNNNLLGVLEFKKLKPISNGVNGIIVSVTAHGVNVMCFK